jgi:hypothetical protein
MSDERCDLTDLPKNSCDHCLERPGSIDLHRVPGRPAGGQGYGDEVVRTEWIDGTPFGLLASEGTAFVFGSGHGLHHRRDCMQGSDTPPDRVLEIDDPDGDLWLAVADPRRPGAPQRTVVNVQGRPVTVMCGLCALRPQSG